MNFRLNRYLQTGYGFLLLTLVIVGIISYTTLGNLLSSNKAVQHSNVVIQKLEHALSITKDAETGQRGYLLTNNKGFLQPYDGAIKSARQLVRDAKNLTVGDKLQQRNLTQVQDILTNRILIFDNLIRKKSSGEPILAADLIKGKQVMDSLRQAIDRSETAERKLLKQRTALLNRYTKYAPMAILAAVILALVVTVISYTRLATILGERERLRHELEQKEHETAAFNEELTAANEELTATNDELFNAQQELSLLNDTLEQKIAERTRALAESEEETQALNEELTAINEELASANEEMLATNEELRRNRIDLEKNERLLRTVAESIPKSLIIVMAPDHRFILIEGDLMKQLGYNGDDYVGKHPLEVGPPERYEANKDLYDRVIAGEQFRMERKGANGADYQVDFVPLRNDENEVYAALIVALDISEIKQAEERSAKLAAIVESSDDAIISKGLDGIISSWNKSAERIFGYQEDEMIGASILKLIPADRQEEEPQIISRIKRGERVDHFETKRMTSDGRLIDVSLTISPVRDKQGNIIGVSKIARDISEKKQDEVRKSDFIGMVSHELKTPLTSLKALIQVVHQKLQNSPDQFLASALGKADLQVRKMTSMINGFLNVSRLESGKIHIEKQPFDLIELLRDVIAESDLIISSHEITLDAPQNVAINADRDKIGSVVSNLISNAVKYSPRGKVVAVKAGLHNGFAHVSVTDDGMGIKPHDLDKIFERYYRIASAHTQTISGFGIGLYLCAEIIGRHEGEIWAESQSGAGSTFHFTLPVS